MHGWNVSVYRLIDSTEIREALTHPADERPLNLVPPTRERIATWHTGLSGLERIEQLVESLGLTLAGGGQPRMYLLRAGDLLSRSETDPPHETRSWSSRGRDVVLHLSEVKPTTDQTAIGSCDPKEWLLIEVREQSQ